MPEILETHIVPEDTPLTRFSDYAIGIFPLYPSKKSVKKAIKSGALQIDGIPAETGHWVKPGQHIQRLAVEAPNLPVYQITLEVVFEDAHLAIISKPAGLATSGNFFKTAQNAIAHNTSPSSLPDALPRPLPAHRLDRDTAGLLVFAKTQSARIHLGAQFEAKTIQKTYRAIVIGQLPESGIWESPIEEKSALTRFQNINEVANCHYGALTLLELYPETGRTHQLRIHCANAGAPILGDPIYGDPEKQGHGKTMFLAAVGLRFTHPETGEEISEMLPMPKKFTQRLKD